MHVLQQLIHVSMVQSLLTSLHSSSTGGHLGSFKVIEKVRQRFYWPGFQDDVRLFVSRCEQCQKRNHPPKHHRHSLIERHASYPFHHIGIDFMGPLPLSKNQHILLIGDHFTKWYEAILLHDRTAITTAKALLEHWICRFGAPSVFIVTSVEIFSPNYSSPSVKPFKSTRLEQRRSARSRTL